MVWSGPSGALTTSFVAGDEVTVITENEVWSFHEISGTTPVAVDLKLEVSMDNGSTWEEYDLPVEALEGSQANHVVVFRVPVYCKFRLSYKRAGGFTDTVCTSSIYLRKHTGVLEEIAPRVTNYQVAIDDTIGGGGSPEDPYTLTGTYAYGDWIETGHGNSAELLVMKTGTNNPDDVYFEVQRKLGSNGHPLDAIDFVAAGAVLHQAMSIHAEDIDATNGLYRLYRFDVDPLTSVRVGAKYSGGTAPNIVAYLRIVKR